MNAIYTEGQLRDAVASAQRANERSAAVREFAAWNAALDCAIVECQIRMNNEQSAYNKTNEFYQGFRGALESFVSAVEAIKRGKDEYPR